MQIQNTKYVHARLSTCRPLKLELLLIILIQERHSKVMVYKAKIPPHSLRAGSCYKRRTYDVLSALHLEIRIRLWLH